MVVVSSMVGIYYNIVFTYTIFYFFASFAKEVPWAHCNNTWNTESCIDFGVARTLAKMNISLSNHTNISKPTSPAEEYWTYVIVSIYHHCISFISCDYC